MLSRIATFRKDKLNDWVAVLECGHLQHVRHDPPWTNRAWVETNEGREATIGKTLNCKKCDEGQPRDLDESTFTEIAGE